MIWFFGILVVLAMGAIALVAAGRGAPMVDEYDDRPDALVPATGDLAGRHLRQVRFSLAARGYRMSEVDALLSRLAAQLEAHEAWRPEATGPPPPSLPPLPDADPTTDPTTDPDADPATDQTSTASGSRRDDVPPG